MFVVVEVHDSAAVDGREGSDRLVVGVTLQLDGAHDVGNGAGGDPSFDQGEQPRGVSDDVAEQPVGSVRRGLETEGTLPQPRHVAKTINLRIERCLVYGENRRTELGE